jgi:ABC-type sulfate transport system permease subunit
MLSTVLFLFQEGDRGAAAGGAVSGLCGIVIAVVMIVSLWMIFQKAGKPGWAAIIPIYNAIVLLEVVGRPTWWVILLYFVPFVNLIIGIIVLFDLAKSFGKGGGFAVGMLLLPFIFYPVLAFGDAEYQGPAAAQV